ncbi:hypothetical protein ACLB2K_071067 [Fragaria x ananassa]
MHSTTTVVDLRISSINWMGRVNHGSNTGLTTTAETDLTIGGGKTGGSRSSFHMQGIRKGGYCLPDSPSISAHPFRDRAETWRDPEVWEEPMEFKPERFLSREGEGFDVTGSREIKMMPFRVGRRICPGLGLALLHLEYLICVQSSLEI